MVQAARGAPLAEPQHAAVLLWGIPLGSQSLTGCRALLNASTSPWGAPRSRAEQGCAFPGGDSLGVWLRAPPDPSRIGSPRPDTAPKISRALLTSSPNLLHFTLSCEPGTRGCSLRVLLLGDRCQTRLPSGAAGCQVAVSDAWALDYGMGSETPEPRGLEHGSVLQQKNLAAKLGWQGEQGQSV